MKNAQEPSNLHQLITDAMAHYHANSLSECEALCTQIITKSPKNFTGNQLLGVIHARRNMMREASKYLLLAHQARPNSKPVIDNLINVKTHIGDWNGLIKFLNGIIKEMPDAYDYIHRRAEIELRLGRKIEAISSYIMCLDAPLSDASTLDSQRADLKTQDFKPIILSAAIAAGHLSLAQEKFKQAHKLLCFGMMLIYKITPDPYASFKPQIDFSAFDKVDDLSMLEIPPRYDDALSFLEKTIAAIVQVRYDLWQENLADELKTDFIAAFDFLTSFQAHHHSAKSNKIIHMEAMLAFDQGDVKTAKKLHQSITPETENDRADQLLLNGKLALHNQALGDAERAYGAYLLIKPNKINILQAQGQILLRLGRVMAATAYFERILELAPESTEAAKAAHHSLADLRLLNGDYEQGFKSKQRDYKTTNFLKSLNLSRDDLIDASWGGIERLNGKRIILFSNSDMIDDVNAQPQKPETSPIDFVIFSRYFPLFGDRPQSVHLLLQKNQESLRPLYEHYRGINGVITMDGEVPQADAWLSLSSLPLLFSTASFEQIPPSLPPHRLHQAVIDQKSKLHTAIDALEAPKNNAIKKKPAPKAKSSKKQQSAQIQATQNAQATGQTWQVWVGLCPQPSHIDADHKDKKHVGNVGDPDDLGNYFNLKKLAELARKIPNCILFCLEANLSQADQSYVEKCGDIIWQAQDLIDYQAQAAMVHAMDFVIGQESLPVHFAGSMNKRGWVILDQFPHWWWGNHDERSPWYPNLRLYRKALGWDVEAVAQEIAEDIEYENKQGIFAAMITKKKRNDPFSNDSVSDDSDDDIH
ncbi:MAG: tetratricopeptide repeat protein [Alphaproteobacteria bacterium]